MLGAVVDEADESLPRYGPPLASLRSALPERTAAARAAVSRQ
jgi:hypothetical protein